MRTFWSWLTKTVKPWRWRPTATLTNQPWYWSLGVEPYVDWAPGFHFDGFGVWLRLGSWALDLAIRDND